MEKVRMLKNKAGWIHIFSILLCLITIVAYSGTSVFAATPKENAVTYMKDMATRTWKPASTLSIQY